MSEQLNIDVEKVWDKAGREGIRYHERGPSLEEVMEQLKTKVFKALPDNQTIVYSSPKCDRCEQLKSWLTKKGIKFKSEWLTTSVMAEAIMKNVFSDPPLFLMKGQLISSYQMFNKQDNLIEYTVGEFINNNLGKSVPSPYDTHVHCKKCDIWVWKHFALERCGVCGSLYRREGKPWRKKHYGEQRVD